MGRQSQLSSQKRFDAHPFLSSRKQPSKNWMHRGFTTSIPERSNLNHALWRATYSLALLSRLEDALDANYFATDDACAGDQDYPSVSRRKHTFAGKYLACLYPNSGFNPVADLATIDAKTFDRLEQNLRRSFATPRGRNLQGTAGAGCGHQPHTSNSAQLRRDSTDEPHSTQKGSPVTVSKCTWPLIALESILGYGMSLQNPMVDGGYDFWQHGIALAKLHSWNRKQTVRRFGWCSRLGAKLPVKRSPSPYHATTSERAVQTIPNGIQLQNLLSSLLDAMVGY
jgi:hypothetical protein